MRISIPVLGTALPLIFALGLSPAAVAAPATQSEVPTPPVLEAKSSETPDVKSFDFDRIKKNRSFDMEVGSKALIHLGAFRRYGVLDSEVIAVHTHPDGDKIVLKAKTAGNTTIGVGRIGFHVTVKAPVQKAPAPESLSAVSP